MRHSLQVDSLRCVDTDSKGIWSKNHWMTNGVHVYILHQKKLAQLYFWFVISGCETALQGRLYECRPRLTESPKNIVDLQCEATHCSCPFIPWPVQTTCGFVWRHEVEYSLTVDEVSLRVQHIHCVVNVDTYMDRKGKSDLKFQNCRWQMQAYTHTHTHTHTHKATFQKAGRDFLLVCDRCSPCTSQLIARTEVHNQALSPPPLLRVREQR